MRILLVAPNVSARMGGEAIIPYHYAREFSALGHDVTLLTHARVRGELTTNKPAPNITIHYIEDSALEKTIYKIGQLFPQAIRESAFGSLILFVTLFRLSRAATKLQRSVGYDIVHQPTPVSPQMPSFLKADDAPLIIGPLNGGINYPPAFEKEYAQGANIVTHLARQSSGLANKIARGKLNADKILVANERTGNSLPAGVDNTKVELLVENGVDLTLWTKSDTTKQSPPVFVYVGRLVWWKAVGLLLDAFAEMDGAATLKVIGDGPDRAALEAHANALNLGNKKIEFLGFRPQAEISDEVKKATALVLPSLRECGGAVILEAFACSTTAIATDWGGPSDYITPQTGFLIDPSEKHEFIRCLTQSMIELANSPEKAVALGRAARHHVETHYAWAAKAQKIIDIFEGERKKSH